jgi:hypothetical protein
VTDTAPAPAPEERRAASGGRASWTLPILLGLVLLVVAKLLPPAASFLIALLAAVLAGALAPSSPLVAGLIVAVPLAVGAAVIAFSDSVATGALVTGALAFYLALSAMAGAVGAMVSDWRDDRTSDEPEARARARRGVIIVVVALLFFGGPNLATRVSDEQAQDRAEKLERRLVAVTKANVPFDGFVFAREPANPISRAVPEVHLIATGDGANMQAEARWGISARCVMVQVAGTSVTSRIDGEGCGVLVGR